MNIWGVFRARFVVNSSARLVINVVAKLVSLVLVVLVARYLGAAELGRYSFVIYLAGVVASVFSLGLPTYLSKELPRSSERGKLLSASTLILSTSSAFLLILAGLSVLVLGYHPNVILALSLASVWVLVSFVDGVFVGEENQVGEIPLAIVKELVRLVVGTVLIFLLGSYLAPVMGQVAASAFFVLLGSIYLLGKLSPHPVSPIKILSHSLFYLLSNVAGIILVYIDTILLYLLAGPVATGLYRVPASIVGSVLQVFPFTVASFPALSRKSSEVGLKRALFTYAPAVVGGAILFQLVTVLLGPPFISLVFGNEYLSTVPVLFLLSFLIPLKAVYFYLLQGAILAGGERIQFIFPSIGALVNALLDLLLIPSWGIVGAASASVFSFLLASMLLVLYLWRGGSWRP